MNRRKVTAPSLDDLPLFASDEELAEAIVGPKEARRWLAERLPAISMKPGFPPIDAFHGGRPVPLVRRFYENYFGTAQGADRDTSARRGREDVSAWKPSKHQA